MNPKNFPERKRLRQLGALERMNPTQAKTGVSNFDEKRKLSERVAEVKRDVRTKKDRSARARFRAA